MNLYLFTLFSLTLCVLGADEKKLVNLSQGPVVGYKEDGNIFAFYGIPYATAPTGQFRYKAPLPPPSWTEPFEATNRIITCPPVNSSEAECLIANVYVPNTSDTKLPVLVIIHGGGFVTGFGDMLQPTTLVKSQKIIAITFNYRLGVNGFLCLGTEDIPGNAGMKDQVMLLRWVRDNIRSFGGNPDDVTIYGYSVGAASATLMTLSHAAQGLFNKVIADSGADLSPFAVQPDPLTNAKNYANSFTNITVDDIQVLGDFFKQTPLSELMAHMNYLNDDFSIDFSPCVENMVTADSFLVDAPMNILKSGHYTKVPILYGFNEMEGLLRIDQFDILSDGMNRNFSNLLPGHLRFESQEQMEATAHLVKSYYFGDKTVGPETVLNFVEYLSDMAFTIDTLRSIKLRLQTGSDQIYLYRYSFTDEQTPVVPYTSVRGAGHITQTGAILDQNSVFTKKYNDSASRMTMKDVMSELWLNFILTGKPVPNISTTLPAWPPVKTYNTPYMSLMLPLTLNESILQDRYEFWERIHDKYYTAPISPIITSGTINIIGNNIIQLSLIVIIGLCSVYV